MELQTPQTSNSDLVTVQVLKGCRPPPIVGIFSFSAEFSVSQIVERETYQVPRYVAQVLSENGYLVITVDPAAAATQAPARLPASVPPTDSE